MIGAVIILALLLAAVTARLILLYHNLRASARDLADINHSETNQKLRLSSPDRELERLTSEINLLLQQKQEGDILHRQTENELRQEIANISHDLRTPLTSILGYVQLMEDRRCTDEEREEYLTVIHSRAQALQILITGFYDLSRLEAGGYAFDLQAVPLETILYELAAAFYVDFTDRQMEPVIECEKDLPPVCADPQAVKRIFTNLIQNALKHGSGTLRITAQRAGNRVLTSFTNPAPDLAEPDVPHLFDRFFTADRMRTGKNTGLGLAIVRKLAQQMGGQASASLESGRLTIVLEWPAMWESGPRG